MVETKLRLIIICVDVVDDLPRNKNISEVNKVESTKQKAHTKFACLKGCVK